MRILLAILSVYLVSCGGGSGSDSSQSSDGTETQESEMVNVSYTYDKLGRIILASYSNGGEIQYEYDQAGNLLRVISVE